MTLTCAKTVRSDCLLSRCSQSHSQARPNHPPALRVTCRKTLQTAQSTPTAFGAMVCPSCCSLSSLVSLAGSVLGAGMCLSTAQTGLPCWALSGSFPWYADCASCFDGGLSFVGTRCAPQSLAPTSNLTLWAVCSTISRCMALAHTPCLLSRSRVHVARLLARGLPPLGSTAVATGLDLMSRELLFTFNASRQFNCIVSIRLFTASLLTYRRAIFFFRSVVRIILGNGPNTVVINSRLLLEFSLLGVMSEVWPQPDMAGWLANTTLASMPLDWKNAVASLLTS